MAGQNGISSGRQAVSHCFRPGEIFASKYQILELLGSGGIGSVYKARQLDCQRLVALKIMHQHAVVDAEYRQRFLREAQALSELCHPNIVKAYYLGDSAQGLPYLVMEYLEGKSLRQLLNETWPVPMLRSLKMIAQAAQALAYVHERGMVHRDLKPENLLVLQIPEADTIKLLDFGLAHVDTNEEQRLTHAGELLGTSAYMSPEQCLGKELDCRSDIYSLTVTLFELITGDKPYTADNAIGLMYQHINNPVPQINLECKKEVRARLNFIIEKGLAKEPESRFENMSQLLAELEQLIVHIEDSAQGKKRATLNKKVFFLVMLISAMLLFVACLLRPTRQEYTDQFARSSSDSFKKLAPRLQLIVIEKTIMKDDLKRATKLADLALSCQTLNIAERTRFLMQRSRCCTEQRESIVYFQQIISLDRQNPHQVPRAFVLKSQSCIAGILQMLNLNNGALALYQSVRESVCNDEPADEIARLDNCSFDSAGLLDVESRICQILAGAGNRKQALEIVRSWSKRECIAATAPWSQLISACLELDCKSEARMLIAECSNAGQLCLMSEVCRSFNKIELAQACLERARRVAEIQSSQVLKTSSLLPSFSQAEFSSPPWRCVQEGDFALAEAYLALACDKPEQAAANIENFVNAGLSQIQNDYQSIFRIKIASALCACGKLKEAKDIYDVVGKELSNKNSHGLHPHKYQSDLPEIETLSKAFVSEESARKTRVEIAEILAQRATPLAYRCRLLIMLGDNCKPSEAGYLLYKEAEDLLSKSNPEPLETKLLLLRCKQRSVRVLIANKLWIQALSLIDSILLDLNKKHMPDASQALAEKFSAGDKEELLLDKIEILIHLDRRKQAAKLFDDTFMNGNVSALARADRLLDIALKLRRVDRANKIASCCNDPNQLLLMAQVYCKWSNPSSARLCVAKSQAILSSAKESALMGAAIIQECYLDIDQGQKSTARRKLLQFSMHRSAQISEAERLFLKDSLNTALALAQ